MAAAVVPRIIQKVDPAFERCVDQLDAICASTDGLPICEPPRPITNTFSPVLPSGRYSVWEGRRLQQLLGILVLNAIKHGVPDAPVRVIVNGESEEVRFEVKNNGVVIEQQTLDRIFDPLRRGPDQENKYDADGNLGTRLSIAREVAKADGGDIEARPDEAETVFAVRLPLCM